MKQKHDIDYISKCRELIVHKLNWQPTAEWRNYEFTELADKIFEQTNIQLSTTTLKRIFGKVKYESSPSSVTLNALAQFLGYENWMAFKAYPLVESSAEGADKIITEAIANATGRKKIFSFNQKLAILSISLMGLTILLGFAFLSKNTDKSIHDYKDIVFKSKPIATGLPNSVVFNVDLKKIKSHKILIQQSWDSTKTIALAPGQREATGIYYIPGYYRAKLIVDDKIVKEHGLFIRSNEWMATIDYDPVPLYIKKDELQLDNGIKVNSSVLNRLKKEEKPVTLSYHLVRPFENLDGDNFILETSFENIPGEGIAVCRTAKVFVLCSNGAFIIPFTIPGCVSNINLKLNDITWSGKSNDLSAFGIDPTETIDLKLQVKNREVKIFYNGKLLRNEKYANAAGNIVGLRYNFLGAGAVNTIQLQNGEGKIVYENAFNKLLR